MHGSPCRGLTIRNKRRSYDRRQIASNGRRAPMPLGRLLERVRERKHARFAETRPADLETDWEASTAEAAWNGNGRQAEDVEWLRVAQRRRDAPWWRYHRAVYRFFDGLGQDRRCRRHEQIDGRKHLRHDAPQ